MKYKDFMMAQSDKILLALLFVLLIVPTIWAYRWHISELTAWLTTTEGSIIGALLTLITGDRNRNRVSDTQSPTVGVTK